MTTAITAEMTPATTQFLGAIGRQAWTDALAIVEAHWLEIWFAVDPADLQQVVAQAPPQVLAGLPSVNYLARATGFGPVEDLHEPELPPDRNTPPAQVAQFIADLRLRGRPGQAMSYYRRREADLHALRGQLVDGSGGATGVMLVQIGITALLAGDAAVAIGMLLTAVDTHRPDRFPFVVREATAKLALAYAVTGDVQEAEAVNERARHLPRTKSWVEAMVDDTIWLTDYVCAVDTFDPRAEEMRQDRVSPVVHREFWPVALATQVRHLVLTERLEHARDLCEAMAAAGLPPANADGLFATALADGKLAAAAGRPVTGFGRTSHRSAQEALSRALHLFATGQHAAVLDVEQPPTPDNRLVRALAVLRAQAKIATGRTAEGRLALLACLEEALSRRTYGTLSFLTRETLDSIREDPVGAQAAELAATRGIPTIEKRVVLTAPLSTAELEVLQLLRQGLTREEMAQQLFLSVNTVKSQLQSVYRKLNVTNRVDALAKAAQLGH